MRRSKYNKVVIQVISNVISIWSADNQDSLSGSGSKRGMPKMKKEDEEN